MTEKRNHVRDFFTYSGVKPNERAKCKHCGDEFALRDRGGRINYLGLNSHLASDVWKARARKQVIP